MQQLPARATFWIRTCSCGGAAVVQQLPANATGCWIQVGTMTYDFAKVEWVNVVELTKAIQQRQGKSPQHLRNTETGMRWIGGGPFQPLDSLLPWVPKAAVEQAWRHSIDSHQRLLNEVVLCHGPSPSLKLCALQQPPLKSATSNRQQESMVSAFGQLKCS